MVHHNQRHEGKGMMTMTYDDFNEQAGGWRAGILCAFRVSGCCPMHVKLA